MGSRNAASELLQSRLRDHQTETARVKRSRAKAARHSEPARDDVFADADDIDSSSNYSARLYQNSPAGPSAWRFADREASTSRRGSTAGSTNGSDTKSMGAREMEEHINKLSKENFDLKLEIFHRRQKAEKLEQDLQRIPALEADHADLLSLNEDLVKELELRDRAVDEAVVRIYDLEQYTDALEQRVADLRNPPALSAAGAGANREAVSNRRDQPDTPHKSNQSRPMRGSVSPEVSARMTGLALSTGGDAGQKRTLPTFLSSNEPSTAALRRMFVEGNKVIRPIPSHATLLEPFEDDDDDEVVADPHDILRSPKLSEMGEEDYRNIATGSPIVSPRKLQPSPTLLQGHESPQRVTARVNRWVADRAISPLYQQDGRAGHLGQNDFQSLEQVLQRPQPEQTLQPKIKERRRLPARNTTDKDNHTPPMTAVPMFGQNIFPPTPETMMTRVSDNSSTSIGPHRATQQQDPIQSVSRSQSLRSQDQHDFFSSRKLDHRPSVPSSLLPLEFEAYEEHQSRANPDGSRDFSPLRGRNYRSDSSEDSPDTPRRRHYQDGSLAGSTMIDVDSMRGYMPPQRVTTSPPRFFNSRRRSLETKQQQHSHLMQMPIPTSIDGTPYNYLARRERASDTHTQSSRSTQSGRRSEQSLTQSPKQKFGPVLGSGIPILSTSDANSQQVSTASVQSHERKNSRAEALRQRFNKFARRTSNTQTLADATATIPAARKRSTSITQRFRLRRNSSASQTAPATPQEMANRAAPFVAPAFTSEPGYASSPSPRRAQSERVTTRRPESQGTPFASSAVGRNRALSPDEPTVVLDQNVTQRPQRARSTSKSGTTTPLAHKATLALASRGRDAAPVSLRSPRGMVRSLSRSGA